MIATFRRGRFLLFPLTASRTQLRLCRLERHRRLSGEAELGAVPPHAVEHHVDPPGRHPVVELVDRLCRRDDRVLIAIERPGLSLRMERRARTPPSRETVGAL